MTCGLMIAGLYWFRYEGPYETVDGYLAVGTAALLNMAVRAWFVSLEFTPDGMVVRNVWRTHRLRWDQVVDAWYVHRTSWKREWVYLRLDNGHVIRVDASTEAHFAWYLALDIKTRLDARR